MVGGEANLFGIYQPYYLDCGRRRRPGRLFIQWYRFSSFLTNKHTLPRIVRRMAAAGA